MKLKIDLALTTNESKLAWLLRLRELLRLEHNEKGLAWQTGETNEATFRKYLHDEFEEKDNLIATEILKYRAAIKADNNLVSKVLNDYFED